MENRRILDSTPEILALLKQVLGAPTGSVPWSLEVIPADRKTGTLSLHNTVKTVRDSSYNRNASFTPIPLGEKKASAKGSITGAQSVGLEEQNGSPVPAKVQRLGSSISAFFSTVLWDGTGAVIASTNGAQKAEQRTGTGFVAVDSPFAETAGELVFSAPVTAFMAGISWDGSGNYVAPTIVGSKQNAQKHPTGNVSVLTLEPAVETKSAQSLFSDFGFD